MEKSTSNYSESNILALDTSIPDNYLLVNNKYYELSKGKYFVLDGRIKEQDSSFITSLYLMSSEVKLDNPDIKSSSGTGCMIEFNIYTIFNNFAEGIYSYDIEEKSAKESFDCFISLENNFNINKGTFKRLNNGILSINRIGNEYEITLKSINISCYYKGALKF